MNGLVYDILHFMTVIFMDIFTQLKLIIMILVSLTCHALVFYAFVFSFEKKYFLDLQIFANFAKGLYVTILYRQKARPCLSDCSALFSFHSCL